MTQERPESERNSSSRRRKRNRIVANHKVYSTRMSEPSLSFSSLSHTLQLLSHSAYLSHRLSHLISPPSPPTLTNFRRITDYSTCSIPASNHLSWIIAKGVYDWRKNESEWVGTCWESQEKGMSENDWEKLTLFTLVSSPSLPLALLHSLLPSWPKWVNVLAYFSSTWPNSAQLVKISLPTRILTSPLRCHSLYSTSMMYQNLQWCGSTLTGRSWKMFIFRVRLTLHHLVFAHSLGLPWLDRIDYNTYPLRFMLCVVQGAQT